MCYREYTSPTTIFINESRFTDNQEWLIVPNRGLTSHSEEVCTVCSGSHYYTVNSIECSKCFVLNYKINKITLDFNE